MTKMAFNLFQLIFSGWNIMPMGIRVFTSSSKRIIRIDVVQPYPNNFGIMNYKKVISETTEIFQKYPTLGFSFFDKAVELQL